MQSPHAASGRRKTRAGNVRHVRAATPRGAGFRPHAPDAPPTACLWPSTARQWTYRSSTGDSAKKKDLERSSANGGNTMCHCGPTRRAIRIRRRKGFPPPSEEEAAQPCAPVSTCRTRTRPPGRASRRDVRKAIHHPLRELRPALSRAHPAAP